MPSPCSSSDSSSEGLAKVSSSSRSASDESGSCSLSRRCCDGDEARDLNDGGGDVGIGYCGPGAAALLLDDDTWSSSSCADT